MLLATGWFVVQVLRPGYLNAADDGIDALDDAYDAQDEQLWTALEQRLQQLPQEYSFVQWQWHRQWNNSRGLLQLSTSRNHRSSAVWDLLAWLAQSSPSNYGLLYVHDDEDVPGRRPDGGDFANVFRVWRLCRGQLSEHADALLSPLVPTVMDPEHAGTPQ